MVIPPQPAAANWNAPFLLLTYPHDSAKTARLAAIPATSLAPLSENTHANAAVLEHIGVALALAYAAGRARMVEIEGCRWRANPHGSLTYCGAAER